MSKNILVDFIKKVIFSTIILILISSGSIYYVKKNNLYTKLGVEIKEHFDLCMNEGKKCFDKNETVVSTNFIKHIKMIDFSFFNILDENNNNLYTYKEPNIEKDTIQFLQNKFSSTRQTTKNKKDIKYDSFKVKNGEYYLSIVYPIIFHHHLIGYVIGYKEINKNIIKGVENNIYHVITTIILSILIFSLVILPIIYNAYKRLKKIEKKLLLNNIETIHTLGNAIALRDSDTNEHNYRVTLYAVKFAVSIGLNQNQIQRLIIGSFLHDVGKIGISDTILLKNSRLTDDEFKIMKEHVNKGIELIKDKEWLENARDIIKYHHEKYDGSGYPNGIIAENIPVIARLFSIVDVFDALTSKRPYKDALNYEDSINLLNQESETHFDKVFLENFIKISKDLYTKINAMSPKQLKDELNSTIKKYFNA